MKGTGNSGKGRFWLTLALVMTLIVIAVTISTTIGAVNVSASDIGKILVNKMSGKDIFQIAVFSCRPSPKIHWLTPMY